MEGEEIEVGGGELLHFDAEEMLFYRIAAEFDIGFPVNGINVEMEKDLVFVGEVVEVIDRLVGLADPLSFEKILILPDDLFFLPQRNMILLRLYLP